MSKPGVNRVLQEAADQPRWKGILRVTDEALVSSDIIGDTHSSIVDAESTMVLRDRVVKVLSWYDTSGATRRGSWTSRASWGRGACSPPPSPDA